MLTILMWTTLKTIKDNVIIFFNQAKAYDYKSYEKVIWRSDELEHTWVQWKGCFRLMVLKPAASATPENLR